MGFGFKG